MASILGVGEDPSKKAAREYVEANKPAPVSSPEATSTQEGFRVEALKEKGFTKEQMNDVLESLGLGENTTGRIKGEIEEAFK